LLIIHLFNVHFAHLFSFLAKKSQAMQMYQIDPSKRLTVKALLDGNFPAIQSTQDQPTPFVAARMIGYIHTDHTIVINTLSANHSSSVYARALQNETTTRSDLDKWDSDGFCTEFHSCMADYYEGILKMQGASGLVVALPRTCTILRSQASEVEPLLWHGSTAGQEAEDDATSAAEPVPAGATCPRLQSWPRRWPSSGPTSAKPAPAGSRRRTNASAADKQ
jgi:hypothetical protein